MSARRLAILHDSPDFGGHERAFLAWAPALLDSPRIRSIDVLVPQANAAFQRELKALASDKLRLTPSPWVKRPAEPYFAPFRRGYGRAVRAFVERVDADLVLLLQGRIENLAVPMFWLPRRLAVVSYLPMAHLGAEMGRSALLSRLTDRVKRAYYARPDRMITPSAAVAAQAVRAGARRPVHVVENVPPAPGRPTPTRTQARQALGLKDGARVALFMGRFDSHQKGLDRLLASLRHEAQALTAWSFLFVGDGPARQDILATAAHAGLTIKVLGWTPEPDAYLAAADVLLAPSRFEGVPLVMLEALRASLPILASDIDVYREYLPPFALHDFGRPAGLAAGLDALTRPDARTRFAEHAKRICSRLDLGRSRDAFLRHLLGTGDAEAPPATCAPEGRPATGSRA